MSARRRAILGYALASAAAVGVAVAVLSVLLGPREAAALRVAAAAAYGIQLASFAALAGARGRAFFVAWGGGTLLRLGVVVAAGVWLAGAESYPALPLLLGLAGFLFALLLLEPFFFRIGLRSE